MKKIYTFFLLTLLSFSVIADTEPANNFFTTPDVIPLNGNVTGSVDYSTDVRDYYKMVTTADGNL